MNHPLLLEVLHGIGYLGGIGVEEMEVLRVTLLLEEAVETAKWSKLLDLWDGREGGEKEREGG